MDGGSLCYLQKVTRCKQLLSCHSTVSAHPLQGCCAGRLWEARAPGCTALPLPGRPPQSTPRGPGRPGSTGEHARACCRCAGLAQDTCGWRQNWESLVAQEPVTHKPDFKRTGRTHTPSKSPSYKCATQWFPAYSPITQPLARAQSRTSSDPNEDPSRSPAVTACRGLDMGVPQKFLLRQECSEGK